MQNYRVPSGRNFGAYKSGSVLPEWVVARAGPVAEQVARGLLETTHEPVNVDLRVPDPKTAMPEGPPPAVVDELNSLRTEAGRLRSDNATLLAQRDALRSNLDARDKALGQMTADHEHLRAACEEHQTARDALEKQVADLTAEVEKLTAPPAPKQPKQPKQQPAAAPAA